MKRQIGHEPVMEGEQLCNKCLQKKSVLEFYVNVHLKCGRSHTCRTCSSAQVCVRMNRKRQENREAVLARQREVRARCKQNHPETIKAAYSRTYQKNKEKRLAWQREYNQRNAERVAAAKRERYLSHKDDHAVFSRRHRAKKIGIVGENHNEDEWRALLQLYGHRCLCCGSTSGQLTHDHVIPFKLGGSDHISNIQPLCISCNSRKMAKTTDYRPIPFFGFLSA